MALTGRGFDMEITITYNKKDGVKVAVYKQPKSMDDIEAASVIEEAIQELKNLQLSMMPNNDHA